MVSGRIIWTDNRFERFRSVYGVPKVFEDLTDAPSTLAAPNLVV
jgi:hypothetical protein